MKKLVSFFMIAMLLVSCAYGTEASFDSAGIPMDSGDVTDVFMFDDSEVALSADDIDIAVPSAILIEKETGTVIYEKNADEQLSPASVTKIMTILLIVEEIENGTLSLDDVVTTSQTAASMGGSQIFLEEGEQMSVHEMLKSIVVASANDACVAMAEHLSGTESAFVARMNEKAAELGMTNTTFINCTGLPVDDSENLTTARDISIMSQAVISHEMIKEYTTIWMDSVRNGEFGLSNTNKLIFYYEGATGLKTGFTQKAMYCLSATAERDGVEYIAVIMHGETSNDRFESAKTLLNYAFANYTLLDVQPDEVLQPIAVELGEVDYVQPVLEDSDGLLLEKTAAANITKIVEMDESVTAPIEAGDKVGTLTVYDGDTEITRISIVAGDSVAKITWGQIFGKFMRIMFTGGVN